MFHFGFSNLWFILILGLIALYVYCILDLVRSDLPGQEKLLWLLIILFIPKIGVLLYFFLGPTRTQRIRREDYYYRKKYQQYN